MVTAMNLSGSLERGGGSRVAELYGRGYLPRRLGRLVPPLAVAWVAALLLAVALGRMALGPQVLLGSFPLPGPGDYYIPVIFQVVALLPLIVWGFRRRPIATVVLLFAADAAFEIAATRVPSWQGSFASGQHPFPYDVWALRYFGAIALGLWLSRSAGLTARRNLWILGAAAISLGYLVWEHQSPGFPLFSPGFERRTNFLAVGLAAALVMAALRWLPSAPRGPLRVVEELGRASYHIYLVQIVWFGVWPEQSLARFLLAVVGTSLAGIAFMRLVPGTSALRLVNVGRGRIVRADSTRQEA